MVERSFIRNAVKLQVAIGWQSIFCHVNVTFPMSTKTLIALGIIPFPDTVSLVGCGLAAFVCIFIVVFNGIALYFNGRRLDSAASIFIQSLFCANFLLGFLQIIMLPVSLLKGGFNWGQMGCNISYIALLVSTAAATMSIASISIERYLITTWNIHLSLSKSYLWIGAVWTYALLGTLSPFLFGFHNQALDLNDAHMYCTLDWMSTEEHTLRLVWVTVISLLIIIVITLASYAGVFYTFHGALKQSGRHKSNTKERVVLIKCLVLTLVFFTLWAPEGFSMAYKAWTKSTPGTLLDVVGKVFISINAVLDPLLVTLLDARLRQDMSTAFSFIKSTKSLSVAQENERINTAACSTSESNSVAATQIINTAQPLSTRHQM